MSQYSPSRSSVHVDRPLTNISIAFLQSADAFVSGRVFPQIPVSKQSDIYFTYDRGEFNRDQVEERAPATESAGGSYDIDQDTYYARVYSIHKDIPDQIRANVDNPLNPDREATEWVTHQMLLQREKNWTANYFTGGVWSFEFDGVASGATAAGSLDPTADANNNVLQWNDASSTPIENIRLAKRVVMENTGFMPNCLTLGRPVYDALLDHPDIVGRIDRGQTSGPARATLVTLADLFEVEEVFVMDAIENTAAKGQPFNHQFIGGKNALLSYKPSAPGIMTPSAGYTFNWTGLTGAGVEGFRISRFRMDLKRADRIEAESSYAQKLVSQDLGFFFEGIVA